MSREDIDTAMTKFRMALMEKNVATEIADKLCDSVAASLEGKKAGRFTSTSAMVRSAMEESIRQILTPKKTIDILHGIQTLKSEGMGPYVIVFCGVNGVGKSTNLSKIAFWLKDNNVKVMIAACDTFRSGAVEQLRVHSRNLSIPLYESGYGKDPASVCQSAIIKAKSEGYECVLVDTAGRMQENEILMQALAKLIYINNPNLVLFVGEALVGNDGVDQLTTFNQKLLEGSRGQGRARELDGIVLTKFDTIDDKVGAALSMVYLTGHPIVFVGTGQEYTDLRRLNVTAVVNALLN